MNGVIDREHSDRLLAMNGLIIGSLGDALAAGAISPEELLAVSDEGRGFDALNAAFADCGAVIKVDAGHRVESIINLGKAL